MLTVVSCFDLFFIYLKCDFQSILLKVENWLSWFHARAKNKLRWLVLYHGVVLIVLTKSGEGYPLGL